MRRKLKFLSLFLMVSAITFFALGTSAHAEEDLDLKAIVDGNTAFAFELFAKLKPKKGNVFLSPYSISTALAMTYAGARGQTQKDMAGVLHFSLEPRRLHQAFRALQEQLDAYQEEGQIELITANALWCQSGYRILNEFLELTNRYYGAGLCEVDFAKATETARKTINAWVDRQTHEKIEELLKPGVLTPLTTLVLSNAIYFNGNWASQFDEERTKPTTFFISQGETVTIPMMFHTSEFTLKELDTFKLIELPYAGNRLSMLVLLPNEIDGLAELESRLTVDNVTKWTDQLGESRPFRTLVVLPKFEIRSSFRLDRTLAAMGMHSPFGSDADFSGITGARELFIDAIIHEAYADVNEEGTEAAGATAVVMARSTAKIAVFRADHPFVFMICGKHPFSILFLGRIMNPKQ